MNYLYKAATVLTGAQILVAGSIFVANFVRARSVGRNAWARAGLEVLTLPAVWILRLFGRSGNKMVLVLQRSGLTSIKFKASALTSPA